MAGKIAKTSFQTGPDDKVAAVDVYRTNTAEIVNGLKDTTVTAAGESITKLNEVVSQQVDTALTELGEAVTIGGLTNLAKNAIANGGFTKDTLLSSFSSLALTKEDALNKLKDAIGGPFNSITNIEGLKTNLVTNLLGSVGYTDNPEALAKGLLGLPGGTTPINALLDTNPKLKIIYNGATLIRDSKDTNRAAGIMSLVNSISGNSELAKVLNMESQFSVLKDLMGMASVYKIPELIDTLLDKFDSDEEKARFLLTSAPDAFRNSDIALIDKIMDANSPELVKAKVGDPVGILLINYRLPLGFDKTNPASYTSASTELINVLNRVDPYWDSTNRNGVMVSNIAPFAVANADALLILSTVTIYAERCMLAGTYRLDSIINISIKNYPWLTGVITDKSMVSV